MISDLWSCMSRSTTQPCWWLPWLLGVPSTLQGDSLLYNADFKLSLGVPSTLKKWLVHNHHEFWSTDEKVEKDLEFTWIQRRSIAWSSSPTGLLSFAPVDNILVKSKPNQTSLPFCSSVWRRRKWRCWWRGWPHQWQRQGWRGCPGRSPRRGWGHGGRGWTLCSPCWEE